MIKNLKWFVFFGLLVWIFVYFSVQARELGDHSMKKNLIGTWRLVSAEDFVAGKWIYPFGEEPRGYFSFSENGRMSVQFMRFPINPKDNINPGDTYLAYFGSYVVDEENSTFSISVEGALDPVLVGTNQVRSFKIIEDKLVVGDLVTYRRSFKKIQ